MLAFLVCLPTVRVLTCDQQNNFTAFVHLKQFIVFSFVLKYKQNSRSQERVGEET